MVWTEIPQEFPSVSKKMLRVFFELHAPEKVIQSVKWAALVFPFKIAQNSGNGKWNRYDLAGAAEGAGPSRHNLPFAGIH